MKFSKAIEHFASAFSGDAVGILQIKDGIFSRTKLDSLMHTRQESISPKARIERLVDAILGDENDEGRQVLIRTAKTVAEPRTHGRSPRQLRSRLKKSNRRVVIDGFGIHRLHEA